MGFRRCFCDFFAKTLQLPTEKGMLWVRGNYQTCNSCQQTQLANFRKTDVISRTINQFRHLCKIQVKPRVIQWRTTHILISHHYGVICEQSVSVSTGTPVYCKCTVCVAKHSLLLHSLTFCLISFEFRWTKSRIVIKSIVVTCIASLVIVQLLISTKQ